MKIIKIAAYFFLFITVLFIVMYVYRFLLMFDNKKVNDLIKAEASQYGTNSKTVENTLHNAVKSIKSDSKLLNSINSSAKAANMDKERVLVNVAISQSINNNLIKA